MCLQWCHVRRWLINNDLPCSGCAYGAAADLPADWSCAECWHLLPRADAQPICGLTQAGLPALGRCCHWRAELAHEGAGALAPWLVDEALRLSAGSLCRDDLSIPLVYGVPAGEWWRAAGYADVQLADEPLDAARRAAIEAAINACADGAGNGERALKSLSAALGPSGEAGLPPGWRAIVAELRQVAGEAIACTHELPVGFRS